LFVTGRQVGRVPANLCRAFRRIKDQHSASDIVCAYNGTCGPITNPFSGQRYRHNFSFNRHKDVEGGGVELSCTYTLKIANAKFEETMHALEGRVGTDILDTIIYA